MKEKITISNYDPVWPENFYNISHHLKSALGDLTADIQHVGSTSVPGLKAKPIIDIDIILKDLSFLKKAIDTLEGIGYKYLGEMGISGRFAFQAPPSLPQNGGSGYHTFPLHNLYICDPSSQAYLNHICLRDHLRDNKKDRISYSKLKDRLAISYPYEIDRYVEGKTDFISAILKKRGMDDKMIQIIREENFRK